MNIIALWCIVLSRSNFDCIAIFQWINRLHNSFAKCLGSDQCTIIIIFDRTCKDFRCTCAVFIDQYCNRQFHALAVRSIIFSLAILIFCVHNRTLRQNLIQYINDRRNQSPRITAHINNHSLHILCLKVLDRSLKLLGGIGLELTDLDISDTVIQHLVAYTRQINIGTFYIHFQCFPGRFTIYLQMYSRTFLSSNVFHKFGQLHARCFNIIHL